MPERIAGLRERAARLRQHVLRCTSEAGSGHPTSCLSAADLIAVLFFDVMRYDPADPGNPAADRLVLSKGHAAPLLYAAWAEAGAFPVDRLMTLRRIDSELEGHPTPRFPGTVAATGSLGQGLSIGFGLAWSAKHLEGSDQRIFVLLGDGEMAEGSVWEAAALAAHYRLSNLIALVDVNAHGQSEGTMLGWNIEAYVERLRSFGWRAIAVDGHDVEEIAAAYATALAEDARPVALVARTVKGKGVSLFERETTWHGKPLQKGEPLDTALSEVGVSNGSLPPVAARAPARPAKTVQTFPEIPAPEYGRDDQVATREAYGTALVKLGAVCRDIVAVDGDTKNSTFAEKIAKAYPDRYLEAYIAEQNMVGAAVGLSAAGKIPFASTFAAFLTRAFDQIRMAAVSRANLKLAGSHAGVSIGEDGPSQMGLEDIAMMRAVPGAVVLCPADAVASERLVDAAARAQGIHYIRLARPKTSILYGKEEAFPIGGSKTLRSSRDDQVTVVATGVTVFEALDASRQLESEGIRIRVIDAYSIRPLDEETIRAAARETRGRVVTVEDHYRGGGLGDAVLGALAEVPATVCRLAVDAVPRSGKPAELRRLFEIDAEGIVERVRRLLSSEDAGAVAAQM